MTSEVGKEREKEPSTTSNQLSPLTHIEKSCSVARNRQNTQLPATWSILCPGRVHAPRTRLPPLTTFIWNVAV